MLRADVRAQRVFRFQALGTPAVRAGKLSGGLVLDAVLPHPSCVPEHTAALWARVAVVRHPAVENTAHACMHPVANREQDT